MLVGEVPLSNILRYFAIGSIVAVVGNALNQTPSVTALLVLSVLLALMLLLLLLVWVAAGGVGIVDVDTAGSADRGGCLQCRVWVHCCCWCCYQNLCDVLGPRQQWYKT